MTDFTSFIDTGLLVLIPALYIVGMFFKRSQRINSRCIPLLLGSVGVVLAASWVLSTSHIVTWQHTLQALFTSFVQGVLCAGTAVYANQIKKQAEKTED